MTLDEITIRNDLRPGDLGYVAHRHGVLYAQEYGYGVAFEAYVAAGLAEFYEHYDRHRDRVWICEHHGRMVGFLLLMHRSETAAQLRFFLIEPEYRGVGLGKKLMGLYMEFLRSCGYRSTYLWTTDELPAAASLYLREGFRLVEEKSSIALGKALMEQRYELKL